jgi:hypothetical protein
LWHSPEVRRQTSFEDLVETTQACSNVLSVSFGIFKRQMLI